MFTYLTVYNLQCIPLLKRLVFDGQRGCGGGEKDKEEVSG